MTRLIKLAAVLGLTYLDTGAMYRAVALKCQQQGVETATVTPALDQVLVLVLGVFALKDPAGLIRDGFRELMLAAPPDVYVKPLEEKILPMKEELDLEEIKIEALDLPEGVTAAAVTSGTSGP